MQIVANHNIAIVDGDKKMTYRELHDLVNQYASYLIDQGVQKGDRIGLSVDRSVELVVSVLATARIGAIYVPVDSAYPQERKSFILEDAEPKLLIVSHQYLDAFPQGALDIEKVMSEVKKHKATSIDYEEDGDDTLALHYTSGSTGTPKGVEVSRKNIERLVSKAKWFKILPEDRILFFANISFDLASFEVWGTLLSGASLYIYPSIPLDLEELAHFLERCKITVAVLTARVFSLLADLPLNKYQFSLRAFGSGGDVMNLFHAQKMASIVPHCTLLNLYGPTENGVISTCYQIDDAAQLESSIPIGKAVDGTQVYILDQNLQPVREKEMGEIYVGGKGLAKGYWRSPDLTKERFIPGPTGETLYRTGDLGRFLSDGNIEFCGRVDYQVKIRGFRVELGEIEVAFKKIRGVSECVCIAWQEGEEDKQLIAYVEGAEHLAPDILREEVKQHLPAYELPAYIFIVERFAASAVGKIDRNKLPNPVEMLKKRGEKSEAPLSSLEQTIADIWATILHLPNVGRSDYFFFIGGHSIKAAQVTLLVNEMFGVEIPSRWIFDEPVLSKYAKKIEEFLATGGCQKNEKEVAKRDLFWEWRDQEAQLDRSIGEKKLPPVPLEQYESPQAIFLTGSTGFIGAFTLVSFLKNTEADIYCLVKAPIVEEGLKRVKDNLEQYGLWEKVFGGRVKVVCGDLEKPLLGLSQERFYNLAKSLDSIVHIGAFVNHVLPYERLKAANVGGTQEVIRLAMSEKMKPLHFASTVDVCDMHQKEVHENDDLEKVKQPFNGYAQGKWVNEKMLLQAKERGLPVNIYRMSRITGSSGTGYGPKKDFLWMMVRACVQIELYPRIGLAENMTPVDFIADAFVYFSKQAKWMGQTYHLLNPHTYRYQDVFDALKELGYAFDTMNYEMWRHTLLEQSAKEGNEEKLLALAHLFSEMDLDAQMHIPHIGCEQMLQAIEGAPIKLPTIDQKLIKKYLDYYLKIGFIDAPSKKYRAHG